MKNKKISPLAQIVILVSGLLIIAGTFYLANYWVNLNSGFKANLVEMNPETSPRTRANPAPSLTASPKPDVSISPDFSSNIATSLQTVRITQWGVQFTAPLASSDIVYGLRDSGFVQLWSPSLQASSGGEHCGTGSLGGIARVSSLDEIGDQKPAATKKIGGYYYYYMHPQYICSSTQSAQDIVMASLKGLKSNLPQSIESY